MKYDFTTVMDRRGHDAIAVDVIPYKNAKVKEGFDAIPMWVADMNFPTLPTIIDALTERIGHHHFGYFKASDAYFDSIIQWHRDRYGVDGLTSGAIGFENGVLGCVASAVQAFTSPGEAILLHSPTYIGFTGTLNNNGRKIVLSDLVRDEDGVWRMDYEDMERKIRRTISTVLFFVLHTIRQGVSGSGKRLRQPWSCTKSMSVSLFLMRSGRILSFRVTGISPHRAFLRTLKTARSQCTRQVKPSTWPVW